MKTRLIILNLACELEKVLSIVLLKPFLIILIFFSKADVLVHDADDLHRANIFFPLNVFDSFFL